MPFKYDYFDANNLIIANFSPVLDAPSLSDYFNRLCNDNRLQPGVVDVVYLYETTHYNLTTDDLYQHQPLVRQLQQKRGYAGGIQVCEGNLSYGIAQTIQSVLAQIRVPIEVLKTPSELPAALRNIREAWKTHQPA